jgi:hypothetical protein
MFDLGRDCIYIYNKMRMNVEWIVIRKYLIKCQISIGVARIGLVLTIDRLILFGYFLFASINKMKFEFNKIFQIFDCL